jgi:hypothetical protein
MGHFVVNVLVYSVDIEIVASTSVVHFSSPKSS